VAISGAGDFLVIAAPKTSVLQYEFVRLKSKDGQREFRPAPSGAVYYGAGTGDLIPFSPEKIGASTWLVSVRHLRRGEYGFLPPDTSVLRSTTGLSSRLYTFCMQ
jgi:hypothetical protein